MSTREILLLISPLLVINLLLIGYALWDLLQADRRVRGDNKLVWGLLIVLFSTFGPLIYLLFGRKDA